MTCLNDEGAGVVAAVANQTDTGVVDPSKAVIVQAETVAVDNAKVVVEQADGVGVHTEPGVLNQTKADSVQAEMVVVDHAEVVIEQADGAMNDKVEVVFNQAEVTVVVQLIEPGFVDQNGIGVGEHVNSVVFEAGAIGQADAIAVDQAEAVVDQAEMDVEKVDAVPLVQADAGVGEQVNSAVLEHTEAGVIDQVDAIAVDQAEAVIDQAEMDVEKVDGVVVEADAGAEKHADGVIDQSNAVIKLTEAGVIVQAEAMAIDQAETAIDQVKADVEQSEADVINQTDAIVAHETEAVVDQAEMDIVQADADFAGQHVEAVIKQTEDEVIAQVETVVAAQAKAGEQTEAVTGSPLDAAIVPAEPGVVEQAEVVSDQTEINIDRTKAVVEQVEAGIVLLTKRRRSSITPELPPPGTAKPKRKLPTWCVLCERPIGDKFDLHLDMLGAVTCLGQRCQRSFHLACLHDIGTKVVDPDTFLCNACSHSLPLCLECNSPIAAGEESVRCKAKNCQRQYHRACWKWEDRPCPVHECHKCASLNVEGESRGFHLSNDKYSCVRCAVSYHVSCIPKTAVRLDLGPCKNKFVCERHQPFPKSIRWRPLLIIPLWVGDGVLSELEFSLPPDWLNGSAGDDDGEDVIIYPQVLPSSKVAPSPPRKKPKKPPHVSKIPVRSAFSYQLAAKKKKLSAQKNRKSPGKKKTQDKKRPAWEPEADDEMQIEGLPSFLDNMEYVPAFSTEPPPGFVMEPYKRRSRNCYVVPRPLQSSREAAHICSCHPEMGCADESCVNRSLQIECDARFCPCGDRCQNQRLQKREWQPMRLIFTEDRGCGMMSQVPIKAGDLVIEYVGEVLDEFTFRQRIQENTEKKRPQDNYYMMQLSRQLVIDARKTGNHARFLNHSCSPNCRTEIWEVAKGELRAGIFAIYDIPAGVELTYDYNFELFSKAVNSDSVPCRCGAKNCSKFLGGKKASRNNSKKQTTKPAPVKEVQLPA